jgi:hypothetical protein
MSTLIRAVAALLLTGAVLSTKADAQSDPSPPTVAITSPASGATVAGTIVVTAGASDNIGVAGVQFRYNGANFGAEAVAPPYSVSADTTTVANGTYTLTAVARDAAGNASVSAPVTITVANTPPASRSPKFIPTFLAYYGAGLPFTAADALALAKFDLIDVDRFRYADIGPMTWAAVKAINPGIQIYLYEMGPEVPNFADAQPQVNLNGLGRYDVSRGHSMGSLNGNQPQLFLLDAAGNRIYNTGYSDPAASRYWYLMDFGGAEYQAYWVEAVRADIVAQPWVADGVHADNCLALSTFVGLSASAPRYGTNAAWSGAMNAFVTAISSGLHAYGQKLWCNRGESRQADGAAAWLALDGVATPPDVVAEEGAFAVAWGASSTQFYSETEWKRQLDTIGAIRNSRVAVFSSTKLAPGGSGTDNWGKPVTYWQSLWYALGSFLLAKYDFLNNAYFNFYGDGGAYDRIWWYEEFDRIDLGRALGPYAAATIGGTRIYWREFERGYVLVNSTPDDVSSIVLPQPCRQLTHDNLSSPPGDPVSAISLGGHSGAILLKSY